jgi:hypothetical protein
VYHIETRSGYLVMVVLRRRMFLRRGLVNLLRKTGIGGSAA